MLEHFLGRPQLDTKPETTAYANAWRPVGARAFDLAQLKDDKTQSVRASWPTFELV